MEKRMPVGQRGKFPVISMRRTDTNDFAHFASSLVAPNAQAIARSRRTTFPQNHVPAERPPYSFIIHLRREKEFSP
jgi:hypothetical protein